MHQHPLRRRLAVGSASCIATVGLLLGACGGEKRPEVTEIGDGTESTSVSGSGSASASGTQGGSASAFKKEDADSVVNVALNEWSIIPTPSSVAPGKIYFVVTNNGDDVHEMAVTKAGAASEEGAYGEVADIGPGETKDLALELKAGEYQLGCFIVAEEQGETEDHFKKGMHTNFTVK